MMDTQWSWIFIYGWIIVTLFRIPHFEVASASPMYSLCDDPDSHLIKVLSLDQNPNPIVVPGSVDFSISVNVTEDIGGPISVDVKTAEREFGGSLRSFPCTNYGLQRCYDDDICNSFDSTDNFQCPSYVTATGLSCSCPFQAGVYSSQNITNDLLFLTGEQELLVTFNVTTPNSTVICIRYNIFLTPFLYGSSR